MDAFLDTNQVAERYKTTPGTVRYWRWAGTGPTGWVRIGRRALLPLARLEEFEARVLAERSITEKPTS
jgi:hypothetical protein